MGFLDSFKKGLEEKTNTINETRNHNYMTVIDREQGRYNNLNKQNDADLIEKIKSEHTSKSDKYIILEILINRGYKKNENGRLEPPSSPL